MPPAPVFTTDASIAAIARGLLDGSLPKAEWTHAGHFAAALWILACRPDIDGPRDLPGIIRAYNEATGVANTDTGGYHETITQASLRAARFWLAEHRGVPLYAMVNGLMRSRYGDKDWLLAYWSRAVLFSVAARLRWVEPDIGRLPF